MATINGTAGNDFIHPSGDGRTVPDGYNGVTGITNSGDIITPGGGADFIYCGSGYDFIEINDAAEINGVAKYIDGGNGKDLLRFHGVSGAIDLTPTTFVRVEGLILIDPPGDVDLTMTPAQISSFSGLTGSGTFARTLHVSEAGAINFVGGLTLTGIYGTSGEDKYNFDAIAWTGLAIFTGDGDDVVTYEDTSGLNQHFPDSFTLDGGDGNDTLTGSRAIFTLDGGKGNDKLTSGNFEDFLNGGRGNDTLIGGRDSDTLTGGKGADLFVYRILDDSRPPGRYVGHDVATPDLIRDFKHEDGDRIDLTRIDEDLVNSGGQSFHLGGSAFTETAGELIQFVKENGRTALVGDIDGDAIPDFEIILNGGPVLADADFVF